MAHLGTLTYDVWKCVPITSNPTCASCNGRFNTVYLRNGGSEALRRLCAACVQTVDNWQSLYREFEYQPPSVLRQYIKPGIFVFNSRY